ncbi:MAG: hypothetical protein R3D62_04110 [Xanthobacteraceae bacterium]
MVAGGENARFPPKASQHPAAASVVQLDLDGYGVVQADRDGNAPAPVCPVVIGDSPNLQSGRRTKSPSFALFSHRPQYKLDRTERTSDHRVQPSNLTSHW